MRLRVLLLNYQMNCRDSAQYRRTVADLGKGPGSPFILGKKRKEAANAAMLPQNHFY